MVDYKAIKARKAKELEGKGSSKNKEQRIRLTPEQRTYILRNRPILKKAVPGIKHDKKRNNRHMTNGEAQ